MNKFFCYVLKTLWTATIVLVCLFAFDFFYTRKKIADGYSPYVQTYKANNNSIDNVDFEYSATRRQVVIRFVAKVYIEDLQLKVVMKDATGYLLDSQIITIGNVLAEKQYIFAAALQDNLITKGKTIHTVELSVYSGTITISTAPGLYYCG